MTKRRLNKRQTARVQQQQQKKRVPLQHNDGSETNHHSALHGIITARYGKRVEVRDVDGNMHDCHLRQNLGSIVVGDQVTWQALGAEGGVVVAVEPRRGELCRFNKFSGNKLIAANIDQLLIVTAVEPPRALNVIDRYLLLAELQGIEPVILFNKVDLLEADELADINDFLHYYHDTLGYTILYTSCVETHGLQALQQQLQAKVSIFVGLSGVGKSSLINALLPAQNASVGSLSDKSREGNHTTTTAKLYALSCGGDLIDCPGIRELAIGNITANDVLYGFKELRQLATECQFRDCSHSHENRCAIKIALENGNLNPDRFSNYQNIIAQLG